MLSYHTCPLATLGGKDTGGMNVYVRDLTRQLGAFGIHVDVYTRSQDEHVPHILHDLGYGNRVVHIPAGPEFPLPKEDLVKFIPEYVSRIEEFADLRGWEYDLIHSHYWMSGIAGIALKDHWHIPLVHMFHTLGVMKQRVARSDEEAEGDYRLEGEKTVLQAADRIVAATLAEMAQLQWLYQADARKILIVPPGVDLTRFYPIPADEAKEFIGIPPCDRMLLFVGRIEPLKGLDTLLEAFSKIQHRELLLNCSICLAVIGGDPATSAENFSAEMARVQEMTIRFGLEGMVTFLGKRSQDTLPYYYSAAEAVVVPSQYESFGMVALEAMACGTPVVASHVGGLAYLVQDGETGFTVPSSDPSALADRLMTLIKDTELRERLGRQAADFARQYGWNIIARRLVNIYELLITNSSHI
jgi:D-inositol-3-phosphate glycosyltransferase